MDSSELLMQQKIDHLRRRYVDSPIDINPSLELVYQDLDAGKPIIIVDDFERENEGDLMLVAEKATVENIAFMARWGRGIMCLPSAGYVLDKMDIPMMVPPEKATDPFNTPFTVSIDAAEDISTGVSASDRVKTIRTLLYSDNPKDLVRPGHLFPLRARDGLLTERRGHTESSVTLAKIFNYAPVAVIVEIMNDDGTMARLPELKELANQHSLHIISIADIVKELNV